MDKENIENGIIDKFLTFVIEKYGETGIKAIEDDKILEKYLDEYMRKVDSLNSTNDVSQNLLNSLNREAFKQMKQIS